jgi:hypothetical protein
MARGNDIEEGAKAIAEDLKLPGGGLKKLARVAENHLGWFDAVEARGMTWGDMIRLLFAAGAKDQNGLFTVGTLSSTVWRKREDVKKQSGDRNRLLSPAVKCNLDREDQITNASVAKSSVETRVGHRRRKRSIDAEQQFKSVPP